MIDEVPWPELPDPAAKPADLTTWPRTLEIIAGIIVGSALAGWAAYLLLS